MLLERIGHIGAARNRVGLRNFVSNFIDKAAPRRFAFLLGENEPCCTAAGRLAEIIGRGANVTLADVEKVFSVEKLPKEFFAKYQQHYAAFLAERLSHNALPIVAPASPFP